MCKGYSPHWVAAESVVEGEGGQLPGHWACRKEPVEEEEQLEEQLQGQHILHTQLLADHHIHRPDNHSHSYTATAGPSLQAILISAHQLVNKPFSILTSHWHSSSLTTQGEGATTYSPAPRGETRLEALETNELHLSAHTHVRVHVLAIV